MSPACDHCYAERDAKRYQPGKVLWGVGADRREFGDKHWNEPLRWARTLPVKLGRRPRVFCASMADVFDKDAPDGARARLFRLIHDTPGLDWLLLTKRIGNATSMIGSAIDEAQRGRGEPLRLWPWPNVWLGATVIDQAEADRDVPKLLQVPARVRFLSIEPMLGPINLFAASPAFKFDTVQKIHWIIAGGESGPHARPVHPDWIRSLRDQCKAAGVAFHLKQHGEWIACETEASTDQPGRAVYPDDGYGVVLGDGRRYQTTTAHGREFVRVGKAAAGRTLDGRQHDGFPA